MATLKDKDVAGLTSNFTEAGTWALPEALTFSHAAYTITMKGNRPENHTNPFADYWKKGGVNADGVVPAEGPREQP